MPQQSTFQRKSNANKSKTFMCYVLSLLSINWIRSAEEWQIPLWSFFLLIKRDVCYLGFLCTSSPPIWQYKIWTQLCVYCNYISPTVSKRVALAMIYKAYIAQQHSLCSCTRCFIFRKNNFSAFSSWNINNIIKSPFTGLFHGVP